MEDSEESEVPEDSKESKVSEESEDSEINTYRAAVGEEEYDEVMGTSVEIWEERCSIVVAKRNREIKGMKERFKAWWGKDFEDCVEAVEFLGSTAE